MIKSGDAGGVDKKTLRRGNFMALIKCPECQKEVSDSAPTCPHCGIAIAKKQVRKKKPVQKKKQAPGLLGWIGIIVVGPILVVLFASFLQDSGCIDTIPVSRKEYSSPPPRTLSSTKLLRVAYGKRLREKFLDEGLNIRVKVRGKYKDRMTLTYILMGDVLIHQMRKSGLVSQIEEAGFRKLILQTGGYRNRRWQWKLEPKQHGFVYK